MANIGIIGGGAAGIMAALSASQNNNNVTIIERKDRLGKKILVTGNGKCNFTNAKMGANFYYTDSEEFINKALSDFGNGDLVLFFNQLGVLSKNKNGYLYPLSEQASTVLEALEYSVKEHAIQVELNTDIASISYSDDCFSVVSVNGKTYTFDKLIVSTGGKSSLGKNEQCNGYNLLRNLGHTITKLYPALTSLKCEGINFKAVSGVRQDCRLSLFVDEELVMDDFGEVLFNDSGISGIVTFQVSHCAIENAREDKNVTIILDLLPGVTEDELKNFMDLKLLTHNELTCDEFITGFVNKKIGTMLLAAYGIDPSSIVSSVDKDVLRECIFSMKFIALKVKTDASFDKSQVTGGGIPLSEIKENFESAICDNLYIVGELLNVDGICGGYNLQWAFTSGYIAGSDAAK